MKMLINGRVSHSEYAARPGFEHSNLSPASALLNTILVVSLIYEEKQQQTKRKQIIIKVLTAIATTEILSLYSDLCNPIGII